MRRSAIVLLLMLAAACAGPEAGPPRAEPPDPAAERPVGIYAAVIRRLTTTGDSTFGEDPSFPVIYVVDHPEDAADDPMETSSSGGEPFSPEVRDGIRRELSDLPIRFISDRDRVILPVEPDGGGVEGEGVVVTLGPLPEGGAKPEVAASLYAGPLAATWLTYIVEEGPDGWEVTGTTGPVAIS